VSTSTQGLDRLSTCSNALRWRLAFCTLICLGLACCDKTHSVTLTWQAPVPVPGVTVVGYNLYRSTTSGGPFVKLASNLPGPRYEDRLVGSGRTYFYVVTAIDQAGRESRYSNEARAAIP
jgi:fibronectin type 3 domain-containing protein